MGDYESRKHRRDDRGGRSNYSENSSEAKSTSKEYSSRGKEDGYEKQLDDYQRYRETSPTPYDGSNKEKTQRPREHAPNNTIILTNLPANVDENWILYSLAELQVQNIKELRLIRDRRTGLPKGFCFVEFFSIYDSQAFYNNFYPSIPIGQQKVYLNYSEPQSGPSGNGMNSEDPNDLNWTCYTCGFFNIRRRFDCYKCNSRKPLALNAHVLYSEANKGLSDVGSIPLHVLLIRQLDKDVSADDLYKRFSQLGVIRRTWIIRDRESNASWGFGFIEFWDVNTAGSILAKISNPAQLPEDFVLIPNHPPILPSFAQMTSFVMAEAPSEWTVPGDQNTNLMYWDVRGYADQYPKELPLAYTEQETKSEEPVVVNNPAIPAVSATPDTAATSSVISEQPTENVHAQLAALYDKISKMDTDLVENIPKPSILKQPIKEKIQNNTVVKKPVQPTSRPGNSKVQAQLNKWNQKQAELRQEEPAESAEEVPTVPVSGANAIPSNPYLKDLLDSEKKACLLCKRQFKTEDELLRHRDVSDLHKQNLNDTELVKKVQEKIKSKFGAYVFNGLNEDGQYRDRAQERRTLYNQPKNPPKSSNPFIQKKPTHNSEPVVEQVAQPPPPPSESIGSKLLKNMGWKEGQGLGRNMDGIVEPVKAESYGQGAGIGSGPKSNHEDAEKNLEYRDRVKNAFRQRFFEEQE